MTEWTEAGSPPGSGKLVLVCNNIEGWMTVAHWNEYKKWWQRGIEELPWKVTHWTPLPIPPPRAILG